MPSVSWGPTDGGWAILTGHSSGLGAAIGDALKKDGWKVIGWSLPEIDVSSRDIVKDEAKRLERVDLLINCAGTNYLEYWPDMEAAAMHQVIDTNVFGIINCAQALLPKLKGGTILNIVSNAGRVPMTASAAYNASKGAALMLTKQMARELKQTHDITVFSVSPNRLANTAMSREIEERVMKMRGWSAQQARDYQLASLPAGVETSIDTLAEFIGFLLSSKERHRYLNGCDITYGGP